MKRCLALWLILIAACATTPAPTAPAPATPAEPPAPATAEPADPAAELDERLAYLTAELEQARDEHHVPGFAVAVVKGNEVIFSRGFGVRDLDTQEPVTEDTIFAIGSSTKAMTATALAMLVDDGKLGWDDPVSKHLPELELAVDADEGTEVTVRDLLTHRTGFPRMSLMWASGKLSRAEIFAYASNAEPAKPFRKTFQYNNVQYMAAGEIAARLAGTSWSELVQTRLLTPLGMATSHTMTSAADADPRRATGYTWWAPEERFEKENHRVLDVIGPAGSIYSNASEMTHWLRFLVGGGVFDGQRLVSESALAETQKPQIEVGPGVQYGLGWMLREIGGRRVVEHGGNIDGYAASVGLFPDDGIGFVMLSNVSASVLQGMMPQLVHDALIGDGYRASGTKLDLSIYEGRYEADMGPLAGQFLTVAAKDGALTLDVPGQTVFALNPPDDNGKWVFKMTDTIAVSFVAEPGEPATAMRLHQGGYDFELPREGYVHPVVVDADAVAPLLGRYRAADNPDRAVTVEIYRGRLTVRAPGPMPLQLDEPDEAGLWRLRARPADAVRFEVEGDTAKALVMVEGGEDGEERRLERVADEAKPATLAAVLKLRNPARRKRAIERAGLIIATGTTKLPQAGMSGKATIYLRGLDRARGETDFGKAGAITAVLAPDGGWEISDFDQPQPLDGLRLAQARAMHPLALHGDWSDTFSEIKLAGTTERDDKTFYRVELTAEGLPPGIATVDAKTGDVVAFRGAVVTAVGNIPVAMRFEDFRKVGGLRIPFRIITEEFQSGENILELQRVRVRQRAKRELFPSALPVGDATPAGAP